MPRVVVQQKGRARRLALLSDLNVPMCVSTWSKSGEPSVLALPSGECYIVFPFASKYAIPKQMIGEALRIVPLAHGAADSNVTKFRGRATASTPK